MSVDTYWDNFEDTNLGDWVMRYDSKLRRNVRVWRNLPKTKPLTRPRWLPVPTTTDPTGAKPVAVPVLPTSPIPILPPGTVMNQTTLDKLLEFGKFQLQNKVELEKARQAAGIAPGTIPTAAQQAAMMQTMADNSAGSQLGKGLDGSLSWIGENIWLVGGVVVVVALLFMNPPGRK